MSVGRLEHLAYPPLPLRARPGRRRRIKLALIVYWRAGELDRTLAAGASPGDNALLALRGQRITGPRNRARTAAGLERVLRHAQATDHGFSAAVAPDRREVLAARTVLAAVDRRLRGTEPVTAQGMAMLQSLLTDGASALYRPAEPGAVGSGLRAAAAALEPRDPDDVVLTAAKARA